MTPAEFLSARQDEDEDWAFGALDDPTASDDHGIARRMVREVGAKRRILARYEELFSERKAHPHDLALAGALLALDGAVKAMAAVYMDHPDYDPAWA